MYLAARCSCWDALRVATRNARVFFFTLGLVSCWLIRTQSRFFLRGVVLSVRICLFLPASSASTATRCYWAFPSPHSQWGMVGFESGK